MYTNPRIEKPETCKTDTIVSMLLLNPHDHIFTYQRPDGSRYLMYYIKGEDPEEWYEEVDGYQMELNLNTQKVLDMAGVKEGSVMEGIFAMYCAAYLIDPESGKSKNKIESFIIINRFFSLSQ